MINSYKDLIVWKMAYELGLGIYKTTQLFPKQEMFGLVSQLRRCSLSIPSNIAEGYYRQSTKEYKRFLRIARGSCAELETQISFTKDMNYMSVEQYETFSQKAVSISKMLFTIQSKL